MVNVLPKNGYAIRMEMIDNHLESLVEVYQPTVLNEIARFFDTGFIDKDMTIFGHNRVDKNTGKNVHQIQLLWKEGTKKHEIIFEWQT